MCQRFRSTDGRIESYRGASLRIADLAAANELLQLEYRFLMRSIRWLPLSRGHLVLVAAATALMMLAFLAIAMNLATLTARDSYTQSTSPRWLATFPDEEAQLRWQPYWDSIDSRTVHVVLAQPLSDDAPPPLGLAEWPEPNEFAISADLEPHLSEIANRWGERSATIPATSLPAADSRIMVYRPVEHLSADFDASGYGIPARYADVLDDPTLTMTTWRTPDYLATTGVALALLPVSVVFLVTVVRRGVSLHSRTLATLEASGVPATTLHRHTLRRNLPGVAAGALVALAVTSMSLVGDLPVPFAQFTSRAIDMRAALGAVLAVLGATAVAVITCLVLATRPPLPARATRPRRDAARWQQVVLAVLCLSATVLFSELAVREATQELANNSGENWAPLLSLTGGVVALTTVGGLVTVTFVGISRLLGRWAAKAESATLLLTGRALRQTATVGIAAAAAGLLVLMTLPATYFNGAQSSALEAQAVVDRVAGRFVTVAARTAQTESAIAGLDGVDSIAMDTLAVEEGGRLYQTVTLYADAATLERWGLATGKSIPATELPHNFDAVTSADSVRSVAAEEPPWEQLGRRGNETLTRDYLILDADGSKVDTARIEYQLSREDSPFSKVQLGGEEWLSSAYNLSTNCDGYPIWVASARSY